MSTAFKVVGADKVMATLREMARTVPKDVAAAMYMEAEYLMRESKREIPVDTGAAKTSSFVDEPKIRFGKVSVRLGYGGVATKINKKTKQPTSQYLIYVHEDMTKRHKHGNAKFLENPAKRRSKFIYERIVRSVKRAIEKRGAV